MSAKAASAKSAPQSSVYEEIEAILRRFSPPFVSGAGGKVGSKRHFDLVSKKTVVVGRQERPEIWFASVIEQKGYTGFYYVPPKGSGVKISPRLQKLLKGTSCFHVKEVDQELLAEIKSALEGGVKHYQREGMI